MEKSEVFKSGQTETAINVSGTLSDHEKVKRNGPELYIKKISSGQKLLRK